MTSKQEKFVNAYASGMSQREAYYAAYPASRKWKESTVDSAACRLLKQPKIKARYDEIINEAKKDAVMDAQKIIEEYSNIASASLSDFYDPAVDPKTGLVWLKPKDWSKVDMRAVKDFQYDKAGNIILTLYSKMDALDRLAKIFHVDEPEDDANTIKVEMDESVGDLFD